MRRIICKIKAFKTGTKHLLVGALLLLFGFINALPENLFEKPTSFILEDSDGNLLSAAIAEDGQWRFPYNKNVPAKFIQCITPFEDRRFFYHPGIDPLA